MSEHEKEGKRREYYRRLLFYSCPYGRLAIIQLKSISCFFALDACPAQLYVAVNSDYVNLWLRKTMLQGAVRCIAYTDFQGVVLS